MLKIIKNKLLIIIVVAIFSVINLLSCSNTADNKQTKTDATQEVADEFDEQEIIKEIDKTRQVNFVNWKPETESYWKELVKIYTEETGVVVNVETISDGVYFDELNKKLKSNNPPTLFEINSYKDLYPFSDIIPVSALKKDNVKTLINVLKNYLTDNVKYYEDDYYTNKSTNFMIAEMVREKIMNLCF